MNYRSFLLFTFSLLILISCSNDKTTSNTQKINYSTLNELDYSVNLEIGETEEYLPGNLNSMVVTSNGNIAVSDQGNVSIEQFSANGDYLGRIADEGEGPGEVSGFFSLTDLGNDTLLVNSTDGTIMKFGVSSEGLYSFVSDEKLDRDANPFSIVAEITSGNYLARKQLVIRDITRYLKNEDDYRFNTYGIINSDGSIQNDSLFSLKTAYPHLVQSGGGFSVNTVPYRFTDQFSVMENGKYLIGRIDSSFIKIFNSDYSVHKAISLNIEEREITDNELEYALKDVDSKVKNDIANRVGDVKPPYTNIWTSSDKIWLLTDTNESGQEIAVLDMDGNPLGKFMLSENDNIEHVEGNYVYTIHKSSEVGDTIRRYKIAF